MNHLNRKKSIIGQNVQCEIICQHVNMLISTQSFVSTVIFAAIGTSVLFADVGCCKITSSVTLDRESGMISTCAGTISADTGSISV